MQGESEEQLKAATETIKQEFGEGRYAELKKRAIEISTLLNVSNSPVYYSGILPYSPEERFEFFDHEYLTQPWQYTDLISGDLFLDKTLWRPVIAPTNPGRLLDLISDAPDDIHHQFHLVTFYELFPALSEQVSYAWVDAICGRNPNLSPSGAEKLLASTVSDIAEFFFSFAPADRPRIAYWLYTCAANYLVGQIGECRLEDNNPGNQMGLAIESLKFFMFPLEGESMDSFQTRMNLLQYLRQKNANLGKPIDSWLEDLNNTAVLSRSQNLRSRIGVEENARTIYRLKANEQYANQSDNIGITFEVDQTKSSLEIPQPGSTIETEIGLITIMEVLRINTEIKFQNFVSVPYAPTVLKGEIQTVNGPRSIEIQLTPSGSNDFTIMPEFDKSLDPVIGNYTASVPYTATTDYMQSRFISRLPWKRHDLEHPSPFLLLGDLLLLAGATGYPENSILQIRKNYLHLLRSLPSDVKFGYTIPLEQALEYIDRQGDIIRHMPMICKRMLYTFLAYETDADYTQAVYTRIFGGNEV